MRWFLRKSYDPSLLYKPGSERIGKTVHEVLPREQADKFLDCVSRALRTGRTVYVEYGLQIEGRQLWFSAAASPMTEDRVVWVARDVTERKRAEETLMQSEQRFKQLFEQSVDALLVHDESGRVVDCNSEACLSLGYTREELLSLYVDDFAANLASDEEIPTSDALWRHTAASELGKPVAGVHLAKHRRKDGTTFPVEVRVGFIDYGGKRMMLASIRDVTELKRAAEALQESEERFRSLIQCSSEIISILEVDGTVRYTSPSMERVLGYRPEERLGTRTFDDVHPEDAERVSRVFAEALARAGVTPPVEYRFRHADGSWRYLETIGNNLLDDPSIRGIVAISLDVTERKRSEELLRQRSAAMAASIDGVAILDENGAYTYLNEAHATIFGYDGPEDLLGKSWKVLYDEGELERLERDVEPALWENGQWRGEAVGKRQDGSTFPQEVSLTAIEGGGHVCVVRDVTERKRAEEELRESEERFRAIFDKAATGISIADPNRRLLETNQAYQELVGYGGEELYGKPIAEISHPDDPPVDDELNKQLFADNLDRYQREKRYVRKDGETIWVRPTVSVVRGAEGEPRFLVGMVEDITERKQAESKLRESEEKYRTLVEQIPAITYIVDLDNPDVLAYASPQMETILGYSMGEETFDFESWIRTIHPDDRERLLAEITRNKKTGGLFRLEYRQITKDGRVVWLRDEAVPVRDAEGRPRFRQGVRFDITERKALEEQLEYQAFHDALTDLPNRALFVDRLEHALARTERREGKVAVLFLDLDNFKFVNDTLGHPVGDELLVSVSGRLKKCLRPADTAARLGGDEFAVLLEDVEGTGEAERVAERIVEELRAPFALGGQEVYVTPSIGITLGGPGQDRPEDLLRKADVAMYRAKGEGKARHKVFDPGMEGQVVERLGLENDLRRALERGEFEVCYQPIVGVDTGRIFGMEALVRWKHPERGLMTPDEFVPLAEETGMIVPIGQRVLEEACRQVKEWQERYPSDPPLLICVNLSARQLRYPDLVGDVERALRESGLSPQRLTLEITESAVVEDEEHSTDTLRRLRDMGVRFALDDFGTGYSSLSYLKRLPVGLLKIDGSFVERLGKEPEDEVLLSGVIGIASGLGLYVLAEGVETPDQLARVRSLGCDLAQGDYFSGPLSTEAVEKLLASSDR